MEEDIDDEDYYYEENIIACITLYDTVKGESNHPSANSLLVHLEVEESRKALISEYEKRLEVVDMLEEIVEWLREMVWVSVTHTDFLEVLAYSS